MSASGINIGEIAEFCAEARERSLAWLERMRTPDMPLGYFRTSEHACHPWTLYGSNSALAIYNTLGLTDKLTGEEKRAWADIFLSRYHPELGLFLCPQLYGDEFRGDPDDYEDRRKAEGAGPFKKLADKVYGLVGEMPRTDDEGTLQFDSTEKLGAFFDEKHAVQPPYGFGSTLGDFFHKRSLWLLGQKRPIDGDPWIEWGYKYLMQKLDPETGMITGKGNDLRMQMNGFFKLSCSTFWRHERPIPTAQTVIDHVLTLADAENGFGPDCEDYNSTLLLSHLCRQENGYRCEEILAVLGAVVLNRLRQRQRPDGGFSFHTEHCLTQINMYKVCDPLPEGDLFGTGQQLSILSEIEKLLKIQ